MSRAMPCGAMRRAAKSSDVLPIGGSPAPRVFGIRWHQRVNGRPGEPLRLTHIEPPHAGALLLSFDDVPRLHPLHRALFSALDDPGLLQPKKRPARTCANGGLSRPRMAEIHRRPGAPAEHHSGRKYYDSGSHGRFLRLLILPPRYSGAEIIYASRSGETAVQPRWASGVLRFELYHRDTPRNAGLAITAIGSAVGRQKNHEVFKCDPG